MEEKAPTRGADAASQQACRKWFQDVLDMYKLDKGCERCGYREDAIALDLDHIDPATKQTKASGFATFYRGFSPSNPAHVARLVAEVRKCRVLCANCHRIKTRDEGDYYSA